MKFRLHEVPSPIGALLIASDGEAVRALDFMDYEDRLRRILRRHYGEVELIPGPAAREYRNAVEAYFGGALTALDGLAVRTGGTDFQRRVWDELRRIPAGTTITYAELANRIGRPGACRAVGLANGSNPVVLVLPCHRVIGTGGSLTGYGGGLHRKRWLLDHERAPGRGLTGTGSSRFSGIGARYDVR